MAKATGTVWMLNFGKARGETHAGWLTEAGYRVLPQDSEGDQAYHAVYIDLSHHEAEGLRQLRRLRRRERRTSIFVLMADPSEERIDAAVRQGALDYLCDGNDRYRLLTTVRNAVDRTRLARRIAAQERGAPPAALEGITRTLDEIERDAIETALNSAHQDLEKVVQQLGIGRATLYRKLKKYRLR